MTHTCATSKRPTSEQKTYTDWKWKVGKKIFQANGQGKKSQSSNTYIRQNRFHNKGRKRDKEGHLIILKGRIYQEATNTVNIYAPNIGAPKHIRKILEDFKKDIDSNILILGDFNTPLSKMDRSSKQNINKDIAEWNNITILLTMTFQLLIGISWH